ERDIDLPSVLVYAYGFKALNTFAAPHARQAARDFLKAIDRRDRRRGAPDHVGGGITEGALRAGIPAQHDAVQRLTPDRITRRFDDGREPVPQFLRALAVGNVACGELEGRDGAALAPLQQALFDVVLQSE